MKRILRWISLVMLIVAVVFVGIAITHPELGSVFYIGDWRVGVDVWHAFYAIYAAVMAGAFILSFFV